MRADSRGARSRGPLSAELITDRDAARRLAAEWDALAAAAARPQMNCAWVLAWSEHVAPRARPRIVVVRDGEQIVGVAPFFVEPALRRWRHDYRLPGIELAAGSAPVAAPGREWGVAGAVATALAAARPAPDVLALEAVPLRSSWSVALAENWPGLRPGRRLYRVFDCPTVAVRHATLDEWLGTRSANFRSQVRRARRRFEQAGGRVRLAGPESLVGDLATFARLHRRRWEGRGHSNLVALGPALLPMLEQAAPDMLAAGTFQLRVLEVDGAAIGAQIFLFAGDRCLYLNGGWDESRGDLMPPQLGLLTLIEELIGRGRPMTLDLGLGLEPYKLRFADGDDPVAWSVLVPVRPRAVLTRARLAPMFARYSVREAVLRGLSPGQAEWLRGARRRLGHG